MEKKTKKQLLIEAATPYILGFVFCAVMATLIVYAPLIAFIVYIVILLFFAIAADYYRKKQYNERYNNDNS